MKRLRKFISICVLMSPLTFIGFAGQGCAPAEGEIITEEAIMGFYISNFCRFGTDTFGNGCRFQ